MQHLRDRRWQAPHLSANGIAHVPWEPVLQSYEELSEAADVLGRPDLASAIQSRVTPELCRKYAPLLAVLRRVAQNPLSVPLPEFPDEDVGPSAQEIWAEAMEGIKADLEVEEFSVSEYDDRDEESSPHEHEPENDGDSAHVNGSQKDVLHLLGVGSPLKPPALKSTNLNHSDLIRELILCLLGFSSLRSSSVSGLSENCCASIWERFDRIATYLADLPEEALAEAHSEILTWQCRSVLQLAARAEHLVARYQRMSKQIDTTGVRMLLEGDINSPAVCYEGEQLVLAPGLPAELRHPLLLSAGECGILAVQIHNVPLPPVALQYISQQQYSAAIYRLHARNAAQLMSFGVRDRLAAAWRALAAVFLAQDPRVLMFINELMQLDPLRSQVQDTHLLYFNASRMLDTIWPNAPFVLDGQYTPVFVEKLDEQLENVLGDGLKRLFPRKKLKESWWTILNAFEAGDQAVELAMAEWASKVNSRILESEKLEPFI